MAPKKLSSPDKPAAKKAHKAVSPRFSPLPSKWSGAQLFSNSPASGGAQRTCTAPVYEFFMAFDEKAAADPEAASELAINTFEDIAGEHGAIKVMPTAVPGTGLAIYKRLGGDVHPFGDALGSELEYKLKFLNDVARQSIACNTAG